MGTSRTWSLYAVASCAVLALSAGVSASEPEPDAGTGAAHEQIPHSAQEPPVTSEGSAEATPPADGAAPADADLMAIEELSLEDLLDEAVVTASGGRAQERVHAAANVIVIRRAQMRQRGWRTLADVLTHIPGLYVVDNHQLPSVGVRGVTGGLRSGSRLIKVMIDGVAVNFRPDLTAFLDSSYLPTSAIERIEIVQGPLSALYGANAFVATINVITRKPGTGLAAELGVHGLLIQGNVGGGQSAFVSSGAENRGFTAAFSMERLDRSGLLVRKTFPAQDGEPGRYGRLFSQASANDISEPMSLFVSTHLGAPGERGGRIAVQGGLQRLDTMGEFVVNSAMTHKSRYALANAWSNLTYGRVYSEAVSIEARIGAATGFPTRDYRLYANDSPYAYYEPRFDYRAFYGGAAVDWAVLGERLSLRLAADAEIDDQTISHYRQTFIIPFGDRKSGDSIDLLPEGMNPRRHISDVGVSLQAQSKPSPQLLPGLNLTGNARVDTIRYGSIEYPLQYSWRAGVVYQWFEGLVTKLVGGRAFQTPSGVLMFAQPGYGHTNNVVGNHTARFVGFPLLEPQVITGAEAIVSAWGFEGFKADVSAYYQHLDNKIVFKQLATDFVAVNEQSADFAGLLANLSYDVGRFGIFAVGSAQREIVDGALVDAPPESYPNMHGTVGVTVKIPEIYAALNAQVRFASERGATQSNQVLNSGSYTLPSYATVDVTLASQELRLFGNQKETRLAATVWNLLDARYSEPGFGGFDVPVSRRSFGISIEHDL